MTRKMKDSGVEWIGEIPEDWEVQNLKSILKERNEMNNPEKTEMILSLTSERGVIPYSEKGDIGNKSKEDLTKYKLVYPEDIVVNSMNVIIGSVGLSKYFGVTSPVYYMLYPRNHIDSIYYYNYLFQTKEFQSKLKGYGNGIMSHRMRIPMMNLNKVHLPYPSSFEQKSIANFLDERTLEIDNIISKTKEVIKEYKKYKQSLITETVTKGLDKDLEMKDSGIEWIGEIPEHWGIIKLKRLFRVLNGKEIDVELGKDNYDSIAVYGSGGIFKYTDKFLRDKPSILFGRKGTIGKPILVKDRFWTVDTMYYTEIINGSIKFIYYILKIFPWQTITTQTALPSITSTDLINNYVSVPPLKEQKQIASYLDKKTGEIDNIISTKEKLITEMEAYKKSLIYETVTGKREVE